LLRWLDNPHKKNEYSFYMPKVNDAHRAQRRRQILEAALRCFAHSGFHATSVQEICREAGLSPGAVYLYFASKEIILEALAESGRRQTAEWAGRCKGLSMPDVIYQVLEQLDQPEALPVFQLDVRLWGEAIHNPRLAALFQHSQAALLDALSEVTMSGRQECGREQARATARFLVAAISGLELQKVMNPELNLGPACAALATALKAI
jgi:AcrR family transcriptional regulator